jgi:diguanylate cyclase (GGDEF)-like protein
MLSQAYLRDPLTGVYSRAMLNARLAEELERANRYREPFSLLLIDIDHFKNVNDAFGHARGDLVLVEFARLVSGKIRSADSVFRFGGDEFVVLLPNTDKANAMISAQRLLEQIRDAPFSDNPPLYISISIGLSTYPQDASTAEGLFEAADLRHQLAKRRGRNQIVSLPDTQPIKPQLSPPSRLIERDMALATLNQFFETLAEQRRSVIRVIGREGVGKSRLLETYRKIARLRGYTVLAIAGRPPLRNRTFAALFDSQVQLPDFQFDPERENSAVALQNYLLEKGQAGMVITVDDLSNIDRSTLTWIRELFYSAGLSQLGVIYADGSSANLRNFPHNISLQEVVHLDPLTPAGIRIWLRQSLQWEAPPEFITWLHEETGGLPRRIAQVLQFVLKQHVLKRKDDSWEYIDGLTEMSIAEFMPLYLDRPPTNIPAALTELIDRTQETFLLKNLIMENQIVTLWGPGGAGKTTLAYQAATELMDSFPDGVFRVSLQQVVEPAAIISALVIAIGLPLDQPAVQVGQLSSYLGARKILFVLDDFPAQLSESAPLSELCQSAPLLHFLLIATRPLNTTRETALELNGLAVPPIVSDDLAEKWASATLFFQAARRVKSEFQLNERNSPWMVQICSLVGGLPLAIEIAAAWSQTYECEEIAARIATSQASHSQPSGEAQLIDSTVEIVLDAFWDLFSATDQLTLCCLTVFQSSFQREIAQRITGASPFFLDALAAKAYLVKTSTGAFRLPKILADYLAKKTLPYSAELARTRTRFVEVYAREVQELRVSLDGLGQRNAFFLMMEEQDNIHAAWIWAVDHQLYASIQTFAPALGTYFHFLGAYQDGYNLFSHAAQRIQDAPLLPDQEPAARRTSLGILLWRAGWFACFSGHPDHGLQLFERGIALLVQEQNIGLQAEALTHLSEVYNRLNDRIKQQGTLQESLILYQRVGDERGICLVHNYLGILAANLGRPEDSQRHFATVRQMAESMGDQPGIARSLNNLGLLAFYQNDFESAHRYLAQSLQLTRTLEIPLLTASVLDSLGKLEFQLGDYHQAARNFREALVIAREMHAQALMLEILVSIAGLWAQVDRTAAALPLLRIAMSHPACPAEEKQRAQLLISKLNQGPEEQPESASLPGTSYELYHIVDDLLESSASALTLES